MELEADRKDGALTARVAGRIDSANAAAFEEAARNAISDDDRVVIMDFERLAYISSAGLRAILLVARSLESRGARFALCSMSDSIREIFEISGFDKIIAVHQNREVALDALAD